ncbi:MAG: carbamoyl-phosphate-synthetase [Planctomycetota bacterium]
MADNDLTSKRLLILGANTETVRLIRSAQNMGVEVGVTDYNPSAPAKRFADVAFDVDGFDIEGLVRLVREEKFDGVMVGVADPLIDPYRRVCEQLELPCYATERQCEVLTNKLVFNSYCREFGIQPIPSYDISPAVEPAELEDVIFPLLVKPVDANSGKGMSVCGNEQELRAAIENAIAFSRSDRYLVQRYMQCDDLLMYFTFQDGKAWISALGDRFTYRGQLDAAPVCVGATYPSRHSELFNSTMLENFQRMFAGLEMGNGVLLISGFVDGENIFVYDPGFRLQGEAPDFHLKSVNGFDQCEMLVRFALTGSMGPVDLDTQNDPDFNGKRAATIWLLLGSGTIDRLEGLDRVRELPEVYEVSQRLFAGDTVTGEMVGTEAQVLARIYLACDSDADRRRSLDRIAEMVSVFDREGGSMLLDGNRFLKPV